MFLISFINELNLKNILFNGSLLLEKTQRANYPNFSGFKELFIGMFLLWCFQRLTTRFFHAAGTWLQPSQLSLIFQESVSDPYLWDFLQPLHLGKLPLFPAFTNFSLVMFDEWEEWPSDMLTLIEFEISNRDIPIPMCQIVV